MKVAVSPRSLFIESSSWLKARMVLEATLLLTRSSSALVIFNVMVLPLMAQVPRIVPVTPWESVLLMNPWGRNCAMKLPPPLKVIDSFMLPTVPSQLPTIFTLYSASATGFARLAGRDAQGQRQKQAEPHKVKVMFHRNLFLSGFVSRGVKPYTDTYPTPSPNIYATLTESST